MGVRILLTGGTFEKTYLPLKGEMGFERSAVADLLAQARVKNAVVQELFLIDSLDMNDQHRLVILEACRQAPETALVIVHGTDTMCETARFLAKEKLPKTIILTGAMVPASLPHSDAAFNLGYAISQAQGGAKGVWVAMNGQAFPAVSCRKNRELGLFENIGQGSF